MSQVHQMIHCRPIIRQIKPAPTPEIWSWLHQSGSLTRRLERQFGEPLQVKVLEQGIQSISVNEAKKLKLNHRARVWVREVELQFDGVPWVLARTLVHPIKPQMKYLFTHAQDKSIGRLLYADPQLTESGPLVRAYTDKSKLGHRIAKHHSDQFKVIGRERLFGFGRFTLLIHEIFLPNARL